MKRSFLSFLPALLGPAAALWADVFIVPQTGSDTIARVTPAGTQSNLIASGLSDPSDVAYDAAGDLFVADAGSGRVLRFPGGSGSPVQIGDTQAGVAALAFDPAGVLHIARPADRAVRKLSGNAFVTVGTLPTGASPRGLAFDPAGDLYVADAGLNRLHRVTPGGGVTEFSNDVMAPFGVAFDASGKLHVSDAQEGGRIVTFNPNGRARALVSGLGSVRGIAFDRTGELFFTTGTGSLRQVVGNGSAEIRGGLADPQHFKARAAQTRVVAYKGQALSDPQDALLAALGSPTTGGGQVAFKATLTPGVAGVASSNALGLWRVDPAGTVALVARQAFPADGVSGAVFAGFGDPILNANGRIAFLATLRVGVGGITSANAAGVWSDVTGSLGPIARKGDPAPGLDPAAKFAAFKQLVLPDDAGPAFLAKATGPGLSSANNIGLWSADASGVLTLVVRKGDAVTVNGAAKTIGSMVLFAPTPFSLGQGRNVAAGRRFTFLAKFTDASQAVLLAEPGQPPAALIARGTSVGGTVPATTFKSFGQPCVSDEATEFGHRSRLTPGLGDVTSLSDGAVFREGATRQLDARRSFLAPGTGSAIFATLDDPVTNAGLGIAFTGKLTPGIGDATSANAAGLWADTGAGLALVARKGDAAPGIKGGGVTFSAFKQFVLPDARGPVFTATLAGGGVTTANNLGLWAGDGSGGIELFLRKGDALTIAGAVRTVAAFKVFTLQPGVAGQSRQFDAAGRVASVVKCTDGMQAVLQFEQP